jgi:pyruvate/2-oxoglutarate dehydrogenase complex dihydrolipoamide dehydrogenase (E3) component
MTEPVHVLPDDNYNRELVNNVHPENWKNPKPAPVYNLVVIGGGTAGLVSAAGAAGLGAKTALIERNLMGGDCLNFGCVPSKAVIRSARVMAENSAAEKYGIGAPGGGSADFGKVMKRMRALRAEISAHDSAARFSAKLGIDVFLGDARFAGNNTIETGGKILKFKKAVIASGARPAVPSVEGLAEAGFLTNETVFSLTELPGKLAVIGGGPIGCELAQVFARLGSEVTIIDRNAHFLPREDEDAAKILEDVFARENIRIISDADVQNVTVSGGKKTIGVVSSGESLSVEADEILVGAGRIPNVDGLNLEAAGVEYDARRGVIVNDGLRTANPRIYAAGDICSQYKFTHTADAMARIVIQNALFMGRARMSALTIPWCTYTDPEIAHVGMYESEAEKKGIGVETIIRHLKDVDRAVLDSEAEGFVKIHVKKGTDTIVGATIVASHAGDMISEITTAIVGNIGLKKLSGTIHPYPTQAEAIKQAGDEFNRSRLTPRVKKVFETWFRWSR